jgi:hypothetical protein
MKDGNGPDAFPENIELCVCGTKDSGKYDPRPAGAGHSPCGHVTLTLGRAEFGPN